VVWKVVTLFSTLSQQVEPPQSVEFELTVKFLVSRLQR